MKHFESTRRLWPLLLGGLWLAGIATGLKTLWRYEATPGNSGEAPARWPKESQLPLASDRATLVMLAHPRCPCTRASVDELAGLMTRLQGRVRAHVLFARPAGQPDDRTETTLWRAAAAIPGVSVRRDDGGSEARRFAAETSGQVVLYDPEGRLLFSGGITALRGHAGDNAGSHAIAALLEGARVETARTPVLGCALEGPKLAGGRDDGRPIQRN